MHFTRTSLFQELPYFNPGARFNKYLKPKIFVIPYKLYGTYENLKFKMLSETGTRFFPKFCLPHLRYECKLPDQNCDFK